MTSSNKLTTEEALVALTLIEKTLDAWELTAPTTVAEFGGRDALAARCEMTSPLLAPVPRLDAGTWEAASLEYETNREHGSINRGS